MPGDALGERYLTLALRLGKLEPELIDSYAGPAALATRVEAEPPPTPGDLLTEIRTLRDLVAEEDDAARRRWIDAQLLALGVAVRSLDGEPFGYAELVERCHGVRPMPADESVFAEAHRRLEDALPGDGSLKERYAAWLSTQFVPSDRLADAIDALASELRARTRELVGLPDDEHAEFELVTGERWSGYARYVGELWSEIFLNTELPIPAYRLLELVAHEVYPGHHTDHVWKELELARKRGYLEVDVYLYPTPQGLVAEGLASLALEILLGADGERVGAECLRPLGVDYDADVSAAVRAAQEMLLPVRANAALLADEQSLSREDAWAYVRRWMIEPDEWVDRAVGAVFEHAWRPYASCYPEGLKLCRRFVNGDPSAFKRLLSEQLTTEDLVR